MSNPAFSSADCSNWTSWTPTYTASGLMTISSVTTTYAKYFKLGNLVFFQLEATGTTGGVASTDIYFTLPVNAIQAAGTFSASVVDTLNIGASAFLNSTSQVGVRRFDVGVFGVGAGRVIKCMGFYQA